MVCIRSLNRRAKKGTFEMRSSHTPAVAAIAAADFDDTNLLPAAGIVPIMDLAARAGLPALAAKHLTVPTDKGANPGAKVMAIVAGMVMGADAIDDMDLLRTGAMDKVIGFPYAPSTLGQFMRKHTFGHVRQQDAVASRFLVALSQITHLLGRRGDTGRVMVDIDDTLVEVYGHAKQGAGVGYTKVKGLNVLAAVVSGDTFAPVIAGTRLRRGPANSVRGAHRMVADALAVTGRTHLVGRPVLVRADSAYYCAEVVAAALTGGAEVSITVKLDKRVRAAIATIDDDAWRKIEYTQAIWDPDTEQFVSAAEVAEVPYVAFASKATKWRVAGRLVVRRVPEANPKAKDGQDELFQMWRHHAFFTTTSPDDLDTVAADKTHRQHAVIEQVHADLKASALAHMPSGKFNANAAGGS
jgi:hypothetical protein